MPELRFTSASDPAYLDLFKQAMVRVGVFPSAYDIDRLARDVYALVPADMRVVNANYMMGHLPDGVTLFKAVPAYRHNAANDYPALPKPSDLDGADYAGTGLTFDGWADLVAGVRDMVHNLTGNEPSAYRCVDLAVDLLASSGVAVSADNPRAFARRVAGALGMQELAALVERYRVGAGFYRWDSELSGAPVAPAGAGGPVSLNGAAFTFQSGVPTP
ncbi:hypothetical protein [Corynebacterium sanguinis]|uniref:hypothetical protein n=1 Tax=Corynebacterium sanguinis TaxID=2594913 RepID=UPI00118658B6|nr:hypothetical protein [Corynebacterium sanguinis]MCT2024300.1 hypothetical protein [Corynebacterium sanguinis]QDR77638.1 hypothetical protein E3227_05900 [Corynebacterium sanguinis]